jgi:hypothetical protein
MEGTGIAEAELAAATHARGAARTDAAAMLDDRCAEDFAIASTRPSAGLRFA